MRLRNLRACKDCIPGGSGPDFAMPAVPCTAAAAAAVQHLHDYDSVKQVRTAQVVLVAPLLVRF